MYSYELPDSIFLWTVICAIFAIAPCAFYDSPHDGQNLSGSGDAAQATTGEKSNIKRGGRNEQRQ